MDEIKAHRLSILVLAAAFVCSAFLFIRSAGDSLNYNESNNLIYAASHSPAQLLKIDDMHPPGFYLLMHYWQKAAGKNEFLLRLPSLLCSVLSILLVYRVGTRIYDQRRALLAALLFVVSPLTVEAAATARPYALMVLLSLISLNSFLHILERDKVIDHSINSAAILAALLLHYYAILLPVSQVILLAIRFRRRPGHVMKWMLFQSAVALAYLPIAYIAATHQLRMVNPSGGAGILTFANFVKLLYAMSPLSQQYHLQISPSLVAVAVFFTLLALLGAFPLAKGGLLLLFVSSPIFIVAAASNAARLKFFQPYHFTFLVPIFALLTANALGKLGKIGYAIAVATLAVALAVPLKGPVPDWRECSRYLQNNARHNDKIIICPSLNNALFYYWPRAQIVPLDSLTRANAEPERIWLILVYENIYFDHDSKKRLLDWFRYLGFSDEPVDTGVTDLQFILLSRQPRVFPHP